MSDEMIIIGEPEDDAFIDGNMALEASDKAAIDLQIATAKQYPRSVSRSLKEALELAIMDEKTAASCFYALPRSGKVIEGPSARLAEIMAYAWGNLRVEADIVATDATHVTAMGTCFDLEKNVAYRVRVKRRITDRRGRRYNDDMIGVTSNAAISIALRNAVFKVIPNSFTQNIYNQARLASIGKAGTLSQKRQKALDLFGKMGVTPEQLYEQLGVDGLQDIGTDHLITLKGLHTALESGETTVEQVFNRSKHSEKTASLNEALSEYRDGGADEAEGSEPAPAAEAVKEGPAKASNPLQEAKILFEMFASVLTEKGVITGIGRAYTDLLSLVDKKYQSKLTTKDFKLGIELLEGIPTDDESDEEQPPPMTDEQLFS